MLQKVSIDQKSYDPVEPASVLILFSLCLKYDKHRATLLLHHV